MLDEMWRRRLPDWCDVSLGIAVTRLTPLDVPLQGQLTVPRQLLYFNFRIRGRGDSLPPLIENTVVSGSGAPQLLLPLAAGPDDAGQDRDRVVEVLGASSAFPFAFPPVTLAYCIYPAVQADACHEADHHDRFIDGGVFDNVPLGLAGALSRSNDPAADQTRFVYLDPDLRAYPLPEPAAAAAAPSVFSHGTVIAQGFVRQARKTELYRRARVTIGRAGPGQAVHRLQPVSAGQRLPRQLLRAVRMGVPAVRLLPGHVRRARTIWPRGTGSRRTADGGRSRRCSPRPSGCRCAACGSGTIPRPRRRARPATATGCATSAILAQIAMNRVYSQCRELSLEQRVRPIANDHCRRAAAGALPPRIAEPVLPLDSTRTVRDSARKETAFDYNLRLLEAYGFHFRDLGVPRDQASGARRVLAHHLREVVEVLADRQPTGNMRRAVRLGTLAVGAIYYEPPPNWWYLIVGTAEEIGGSVAGPGLPDWLRLNGALRVEGIVSLVTTDPNRFAAGMFAGPEIELRPFTRLRQMITIAPRVGYQFSQGDRFGSRRCDAAGTRGDGRDCSQVVLQAAGSVVAYERVRLQVSVDYFTRKVGFDDRRYDVQLAMGVQF